VLSGAARRRIFGEYQSSEPSRFIDEIPDALIERTAPAFSSYQRGFSGYDARPGSSARGHRVREPEPTYSYEDEDQRTGMALRQGMRVRHPHFGVGSIVSVEPLEDDTKLVVRFNTVGQKTLRAKFARLEPA
jgi:DNA helicase-2/ATP-dependent DNA helicase PcrA